MCSHFDEITTTLLTMSTSEAFLVKGKEKIEPQIVFHVSKSNSTTTSTSTSTSSSPPTLGFQDSNNSHVSDHHQQGKEAGKLPTLGGLGATSEKDESGFKTPTSIDHKIPEVVQCPGAPRKPKFRFASRKRKASSSSSTSSSSPSLSPSSSTPPSSGARRSLLLDVSQEVESLFPKPILADTHRETKRARTTSGDN